MFRKFFGMNDEDSFRKFFATWVYLFVLVSSVYFAILPFNIFSSPFISFISVIFFYWSGYLLPGSVFLALILTISVYSIKKSYIVGAIYLVIFHIIIGILVWIEGGGGLIIHPVFLLPFSLVLIGILVPIVHFIERGFNKIKSKVMRIAVLIILIVLFILVGFANLTSCGFGAYEDCLGFETIEVAVESNSLEACEEISPSALGLREKCYFDIAILRGDYEICINYMEGESGSAFSCRNEVVKKLTLTGEFTTNYCDMETEDVWRDRCYLYFARASEDSSLCDLIPDNSYQKEVCIREV